MRSSSARQVSSSPLSYSGSRALGEGPCSEGGLLRCSSHPRSWRGGLSSKPSFLISTPTRDSLTATALSHIGGPFFIPRSQNYPCSITSSPTTSNNSDDLFSACILAPAHPFTHNFLFLFSPPLCQMMVTANWRSFGSKS